MAHSPKPAPGDDRFRMKKLARHLVKRAKDVTALKTGGTGGQTFGLNGLRLRLLTLEEIHHCRRTYEALGKQLFGSAADIPWRVGNVLRTMRCDKGGLPSDPQLLEMLEQVGYHPSLATRISLPQFLLLLELVKARQLRQMDDAAGEEMDLGDAFSAVGGRAPAPGAAGAEAPIAALSDLFAEYGLESGDEMFGLRPGDRNISYDELRVLLEDQTEHEAVLTFASLGASLPDLSNEAIAQRLQCGEEQLGQAIRNLAAETDGASDWYRGLTVDVPTLRIYAPRIGVAAGELERFVAAVDLNTDGRVTFDEFLVFTREAQAYSRRQRRHVIEMLQSRAHGVPLQEADTMPAGPVPALGSRACSENGSRGSVPSPAKSTEEPASRTGRILVAVPRMSRVLPITDSATVLTRRMRDILGRLRGRLRQSPLYSQRRGKGALPRCASSLVLSGHTQLNSAFTMHSFRFVSRTLPVRHAAVSAGVAVLIAAAEDADRVTRLHSHSTGASWVPRPLPTPTLDEATESSPSAEPQDVGWVRHQAPFTAPVAAAGPSINAAIRTLGMLPPPPPLPLAKQDWTAPPSPPAPYSPPARSPYKGPLTLPVEQRPPPPPPPTRPRLSTEHRAAALYRQAAAEAWRGRRRRPPPPAGSSPRRLQMEDLPSWMAPQQAPPPRLPVGFGDGAAAVAVRQLLALPDEGGRKEVGSMSPPPSPPPPPPPQPDLEHHSLWLSHFVATEPLAASAPKPPAPRPPPRAAVKPAAARQPRRPWTARAPRPRPRLSEGPPERQQQPDRPRLPSLLPPPRPRTCDDRALPSVLAERPEWLVGTPDESRWMQEPQRPARSST